MAKTFKDFNQGTINQLIKEDSALLCLLEGNNRDILKSLDKHSIRKSIRDVESFKDNFTLYLLTLRAYYTNGNEYLKPYMEYMLEHLREQQYKHSHALNINLHEYAANMGAFPFFMESYVANNFERFHKFIYDYGQKMIPTIFLKTTELEEGEYGEGFTKIEYKEITVTNSELAKLYHRETSFGTTFENNRIYSELIDLFLSKYKNNEEMKKQLVGRIASLAPLLNPCFYLISQPYIMEIPFTNEYGTFSHYIEFGVTVSSVVKQPPLTLQNYHLLQNHLYNFYCFLYYSISDKEN